MSEELQEPISKEQHYLNHAGSLADEHARALLAYRESTRELRIDTLAVDGIDNMSKHDLGPRAKRRAAAELARNALDEVELRMKAKAKEAHTELKDPDPS